MSYTIDKKLDRFFKRTTALGAAMSLLFTAYAPLYAVVKSAESHHLRKALLSMNSKAAQDISKRVAEELASQKEKIALANQPALKEDREVLVAAASFIQPYISLASLQPAVNAPPTSAILRGMSAPFSGVRYHHADGGDGDSLKARKVRGSKKVTKGANAGRMMQRMEVEDRIISIIKRARAADLPLKRESVASAKYATDDLRREVHEAYSQVVKSRHTEREYFYGSWNMALDAGGVSSDYLAHQELIAQKLERERLEPQIITAILNAVHVGLPVHRKVVCSRPDEYNTPAYHVYRAYRRVVWEEEQCFNRRWELALQAAGVNETVNLNSYYEKKRQEELEIIGTIQEADKTGFIIAGGGHQAAQDQKDSDLGKNLRIAYGRVSRSKDDLRPLFNGSWQDAMEAAKIPAIKRYGGEEASIRGKIKRKEVEDRIISIIKRARAADLPLIQESVASAEYATDDLRREVHEAYLQVIESRSLGGTRYFRGVWKNALYRAGAADVATKQQKVANKLAREQLELMIISTIKRAEEAGFIISGGGLSAPLSQIDSELGRELSSAYGRVLRSKDKDDPLFGGSWQEAMRAAKIPAEKIQPKKTVPSKPKKPREPKWNERYILDVIRTAESKGLSLSIDAIKSKKQSEDYLDRELSQAYRHVVKFKEGETPFFNGSWDEAKKAAGAGLLDEEWTEDKIISVIIDALESGVDVSVNGIDWPDLYGTDIHLAYQTVVNSKHEEHPFFNGSWNEAVIAARSKLQSSHNIADQNRDQIGGIMPKVKEWVLKRFPMISSRKYDRFWSALFENTQAYILSIPVGALVFFWTQDFELAFKASYVTTWSFIFVAEHFLKNSKGMRASPINISFAGFISLVNLSLPYLLPHLSISASFVIPSVFVGSYIVHAVVNNIMGNFDELRKYLDSEEKLKGLLAVKKYDQHPLSNLTYSLIHKALFRINVKEEKQIVLVDLDQLVQESEGNQIKASMRLRKALEGVKDRLNDEDEPVKMLGFVKGSDKIDAVVKTLLEKYGISEKFVLFSVRSKEEARKKSEGYKIAFVVTAFPEDWRGFVNNILTLGEQIKVSGPLALELKVLIENMGFVTEKGIEWNSLTNELTLRQKNLPENLENLNTSETFQIQA